MKANRQNLYRHVDFLTSIYPYRNFQNIQSLNKAANFIEEEFEKYKLPTSRQQWTAKGNLYENIIASFLPEKTKRFILGAHYDVYKDSPGADDNASSVAGLLEIARLISKNNPHLDYGIDFISYCLEEPPFFKKKEMGSYVHAKSILDKDMEYLGMISLEMIGYYRRSEENEDIPDSPKNLLIVSGIKKFDVFNKKISQLLKAFGEIDSRRLSYADNYSNNGPSDHRNYWQLDIPAVMIIGTGGHGNPNYHTENDTIDTLDFDIMTSAVSSIAHAISNISE
jgi:Zn-dependent M28 family amino/carboxypeptidase